MGCTPPIRTLTIANRAVVFSKGGGTGTDPSGVSEVFVLSPDSIMQIAPMLSDVRATLRTENATAAFECKVVYQTTNDGETWDTPVDIGTYLVGDGYVTSDWTMVGNTKRGIRFGVVCAQNSGTAVESGRVTVILDLKLVS